MIKVFGENFSRVFRRNVGFSFTFSNVDISAAQAARYYIYVYTGLNAVAAICHFTHAEVSAALYMFD